MEIIMRERGPQKEKERKDREKQIWRYSRCRLDLEIHVRKSNKHKRLLE